MENYRKMVKVYFENLGNNGASNYAEVVATFKNEETYIECLPVLEKMAKDAGMIVTESLDGVSTLSLIEWLKENKKILHIRNIEKRIGIPDSTIGKALSGTRNLPDKWVEPLKKFRKTLDV